VVGRPEIVDLLDYDDGKRGGRAKIPHYGTFNANPTSAAAGIAALGIIASTDACARANDFAARLRGALNEVFEAEGVPWAFYGTFSGFHLFTNPDGLDITPTAFDAGALSHQQLTAASKETVRKFRLAMLVHGVDFNARCDGVVSTAHGDADLAATVDALRGSLAMLRREGEVQAGHA
jgi:glutamate-1-semialdehyde 2,1-aminomutase